MKILDYCRIAGLCGALLAGVGADAETYISDTRYDWGGLAESITSASKPDYEKATDIYNWITKNIAYDTTYSINTADETYENQCGVCQGYCELFYRLAEAVGLRSEIIFGKSKDLHGRIDDAGHAWLFVYTNGNSGILVDPTWGAGTVDGGRFERKVTDVWFHVDPKWMIFTHFPDEEVFQLIGDKIDYGTFSRLPSLRPSLEKFGYEAEDMLSKCLAGAEPQLPTFYDATISQYCGGVQFPKEATLRVGSDYEFYAVPKSGTRLVVRNGDNCVYDWQDCGDYKGVRFMPSEGGSLCVGAVENDKINIFVEYTVASPTAEDIARLEGAYPLLSPSLVKLPNFNKDVYEELGIDGALILKAVKSENVMLLPKVYTQAGCRPVEIPWNGRLKAGNSYTFVLTPGKGVNFAAVNNQNWFKEWTRDPSTGNIIITTGDLSAGKLGIYATSDAKETGMYDGVLEYEVK